jgi:hypothetical protein
MKIEEAWIQASETTGVDLINVEIGTGLTLLLISFEVAWWFGLGLFLKSRVTSKSDDV